MAIIPEKVRTTLTDRPENHARTAWDERCERVNVRFRGEYAYIETIESDPWIHFDATEQEIGQIRQTPTKLCRLTWTGNHDTWGFAFYKYSDDRYEPSICLDGSFASSPESCFDTAAQLYLQ